MTSVVPYICKKEAKNGGGMQEVQKNGVFVF